MTRSPAFALALIGAVALAPAAPAQTDGALTPELIYGRGGQYANPQPDVIVAVLGQLQNRQDDFAVLDRGRDEYMQTIGGPQVFRLEVRDGSADRHYGCFVGKEQVVATFLSYASGDDEAWRSACDWIKLNL